VAKLLLLIPGFMQMHIELFILAFSTYSWHIGTVFHLFAALPTDTPGTSLVVRLLVDAAQHRGYTAAMQLALSLPGKQAWRRWWVGARDHCV
jgi:hypothetical protein